MGGPGEVEQRNAFFHVGFIGVPVAVDLLLAAVLLLAPLVRLYFEEGRIDEPVELVNIHGVNALLEPLVFRLMALDRFLVFSALVGMAGVQRIAHPFQHLAVNLSRPSSSVNCASSASSRTYLRRQLARIALALIGIAGAVAG